MVTEERTNTPIPESEECEFEWGNCLVLEAEGYQPATHMCRSSKKAHDGLHGCGDCGVVYLKRRE